MPPPTSAPIGITLTRTARAVERAFDDALAAAGGSRPIWLILMAVKNGATKTQQELAEAVGIGGATLTHHLNAMEQAGLLTRSRRPENRREHRVELTSEGMQKFTALVGVARAHDRKLRSGLSAADVQQLESALQRLHANVSG